VGAECVVLGEQRVTSTYSQWERGREGKKLIEQMLPHLRSPITGSSPLHVDSTVDVERAPAVGLMTARLLGPQGQDPSIVELGVWHAIGRDRAARTIAQITNMAPIVPEMYEAIWRRRSLGLLSGRPFTIDEELAEMTAAIGEIDGGVVIDVGCSEGLYARHLARAGARVIAIDHSQGFLRRMLHRAAMSGVHVAAVRALAQRLPVLDGHADAVVIGGSLNEIGDRANIPDPVTR
jgi:SAM-dependent methyltransferase